MKLFSGCFKIILLLIIFTGVYGYRQFFVPLKADGTIDIAVEQGESVATLAQKLEEQEIIRSAWVFKKYLQLNNLDTKIQAGNFSLQPPFSFSSLAESLLQESSRAERELTIIPGWTNRQVAAYLAEQGYGDAGEIEKMIGVSAQDYRITPQQIFDTQDFDFLSAIPDGAGLEGFIAPNTIRVFESDSLETVLNKFLAQRQKEFTPELLEQIKNSGRSFYDIMIVASLLEKEVRGAEAKAKVADLFWRRLDEGWAMQADSTVHYLTGKSGNVFTSAADRNIDSPWNTYKYPGLPLGPIANPSVLAIQAAANPEPNDYYYFITTLDTGEVKYGRTLDEHNLNVQKYLR